VYTLPPAPLSDQLARERRSRSAPRSSAVRKLACGQAVGEVQARQRSSLVPSSGKVGTMTAGQKLLPAPHFQCVKKPASLMEAGFFMPKFAGKTGHVSIL
jgi:hypothetical protein